MRTETHAKPRARQRPGADEQKRLYLRWRDHGDTAALATLMESVAALIRQVASRAASRGNRALSSGALAAADKDDLIGEINALILTGLPEFDPAKGSWVTWCMARAHGAVLHFRDRVSPLIRIPSHRLYGDPDAKQTLPRVHQSTSHGADDTGAEAAPDPYEDVLLAVFLDDLICRARLDEREATIFRLFAEGREAQEIARLLPPAPGTDTPITRQRVDQIYGRALRRIAPAFRAMRPDLPDTVFTGRTGRSRNT